ncbi:hypothetical protein ISF_02657 [Cordyceps fumosorosea ARSEF 2679]|uniref:Uncharacterized protein n=1 Tax=Cordyceps fumosorosea (strain ARSEF 2679) TaxID=1081104 RepID=A0A168BXS7_CORFA|nr:hypothetical protein ISF_02657 [Cordyceps fumosorosea ARSEF 2679]OAA70683.1 hypothetical protein ISF_02657 [Cordyceps fumosorosea ARSEF 2679]
MAMLPVTTFRRTPSGYRARVFTKRPLNCIEIFDCDGIALRIGSNPSMPGPEIQTELDRLSNIRYHVFNRPSTSDRVIGPIDEVLKQYYISVFTAVDRVRINLRQQLDEIDATIGAQLGNVATTLPWCLSPVRRKAKQCAKAIKARLRAQATELAEARKQFLLEAMEDMYRQLTVNAFFRSSLSRETLPYTHNGVLQGCWDSGPIMPSDVARKTGDADAFYHIRVSWISAPGATRYPTFLWIERQTDGSFPQGYVNWVPYRPGKDDDYDLEQGESGEYFITHSRKISVDVRVRCHFVKNVVARERVVRERLELLEEGYVRVLPFWRSALYKPGDFLKDFENAHQTLLHPFSW